MEDLYTFFDINEFEPQSFECLADTYGFKDKLKILEERNIHSRDSFHHELLFLAVDMMAEGMAYLPFAAVIAGHVIMHMDAPAVKRKAEHLLDLFDDIQSRAVVDDNSRCCAFETCFCLARQVPVDKPLSHRVHENFLAAMNGAMDITDNDLLLEMLTFAACSATTYPVATSLLAASMTEYFNIMLASVVAEDVSGEQRSAKWSYISYVAMNVGINLGEDQALSEVLAHYFSEAWDNLYKAKNENAHEIIKQYLSNDMERENISSIFNQLLLQKAETLFGQKPILGPSYPALIKPNNPPSSDLAPAP